MFKSTIHRYIYLFGIILTVVSIPFSPFFLSCGQFILVGNWVIEMDYERKLKCLLTRKSILLFSSFYLIHLIWLLNTTDFNYAWNDLRIKLPLLGFPIIIGTSSMITKNEFRIILHFFMASILVATLISFVVYLGWTPIEPIDNRSLSIFISHIRMSLLIDLCIFILLSILICNSNLQLIHKNFYILLLVWFLVFIVFLGAFTGLAILLLVSPFALFFWLSSKENPLYKRWAVLGISSLIICCSVYILLSFHKFNQRNVLDCKQLPVKTISGNYYQHYCNWVDYENKDLVWVNICEVELEDGWNKVSKIDYKGKDQKNQNIRTTIIRYITSLGYKKDSIGLSKLTPVDISMIEEGYTNYIYKKKFSLYPRLYELFWEVEQYVKYGNPSGHSLTQRIEFVKNALGVIKRHFWFGTGTGDVKYEINYQYKTDNSILDQQWQLRAHNQLVTLLLTFGLIGFILIIICVSSTIYIERRNIDFISFSFLLIILFSMLNEDTLETQVGAVFFSFFFSLFLLGRNFKVKPE